VTRGLRLGAVLVLAALAAVGALRAPGPPRADRVAPTVISRDPELARCRRAGEAGGRDLACQAAWRRARERFLGGAAS